MTTADRSVRRLAIARAETTLRFGAMAAYLLGVGWLLLHLRVGDSPVLSASVIVVAGVAWAGAVIGGVFMFAAALSVADYVVAVLAREDPVRGGWRAGKPWDVRSDADLHHGEDR